MLKKRAIITFLALLSIGILHGSFSTQAFAADRRHHSKVSHSRHEDKYERLNFLPRLFAKLIFSMGDRYYYYHGSFYKYSSRGYILAPAPVGATVTTLSSGYEVISVNGNTYFYVNDTYFIKRGNKYIVVEKPVYSVTTYSSPVVVTAPPSQPGMVVSLNSAEAFTVNIPNNQGGYTAVLIKKSGHGFTGPQGEYYSAFPTVEQLKVMYGNS